MDGHGQTPCSNQPWPKSHRRLAAASPRSQEQNSELDAKMWGGTTNIASASYTWCPSKTSTQKMFLKTDTQPPVFLGSAASQLVVSMWNPFKPAQNKRIAFASQKHKKELSKNNPRTNLQACPSISQALSPLLSAFPQNPAGGPSFAHGKRWALL